MPIDLNKYRDYVDDFDLTEDQKTELIQTVASIIQSFADQAFGFHPVQQHLKQPIEECLQSPSENVESKNRQLNKVFQTEVSPRVELKMDSLKK